VSCVSICKNVSLDKKRIKEKIELKERKKEKYKSIHLGPFLPFDRLTDR
jgi:hypothetical protein